MSRRRLQQRVERRLFLAAVNITRIAEFPDNRRRRTSPRKKTDSHTGASIVFGNVHRACTASTRDIAVGIIATSEKTIFFSRPIKPAGCGPKVEFCRRAYFAARVSQSRISEIFCCVFRYERGRGGEWRDLLIPARSARKFAPSRPRLSRVLERRRGG